MTVKSIEGVWNRGDRAPDTFFAGSLTGAKEEGKIGVKALFRLNRDTAVLCGLKELAGHAA
jgi:hypothetical protein